MHKYSSYILFLLITFLVVIISVNGFGPLENLQQSINDSLCRLTADNNVKQNITVVSIDSKTADEFGEWPWNYDLVGDLIAAIGHGEPKVVALDFQLPENYNQDSSGYTAVLAEQIQWVNNVVVPYDVALTTFRDNRTNNPQYLYDYSISVDNPLGLISEEATLHARKIFMPNQNILANGALLGFDYMAPDEDRIMRHHPLLINYDGYYYPSQALLTAAAYMDVPPSQIKLYENDKIGLAGKREIPINNKTEFYVNFSSPSSFQKISAVDILNEKYNLSNLKNKIVILTVDDPSTATYYNTPIKDLTPKAIVNASIIDNIINNNFISKPNSAALINLLILFLIGGLCAFFMPKLPLLKRMLILGSVLTVTAAVQYLLFSLYSTFFDTIYIALELLLFIMAAPLLDSALLADPEELEQAKAARKKKIKKAKAVIQTEEDLAAIPVREIKENLESSGHQETVTIDSVSASDKEDFTKTTMSDSDNFDHQSLDIGDEQMDNDSANDSGYGELPNLGFDENPEALESGSIISEDENEYDENEPLENEDILKETGETESNANIKKLGRYQVTGTLGRGAMGHVYKGIDPAINRLVALKTIRLDFVNDPEELAELKERLHREAQAAGKLSHPNIVTIYDVGSEGHLQYIAMEHLEGRTLEDLIKKKSNFNYKILTKVIIQISDALDYAHERGIVHRDIKPANIMILKDYTVKIMDYGIARIDSNSMTKTGIAMGTPNYISPEQLQGKPVDKRADIFSLGVVMYELLLGRRPFKGENITSLIYSIINTEPEKPSNLNPQIPLLFDNIIRKSLAKDPATRYQKAGEIATDLKDFVDAFSVK